MRIRHGECHRCAAHDRGDGVGAVPFGVRCAGHGDLVTNDERVAVGQRCRCGRAAAGGCEWHAWTVVHRERHRSASWDGEASGEVAAGVAHAAADIGWVRLAEGVVGGVVADKRIGIDAVKSVLDVAGCRAAIKNPTSCVNRLSSVWRADECAAESVGRTGVCGGNGGRGVGGSNCASCANESSA